MNNISFSGKASFHEVSGSEQVKTFSADSTKMLTLGTEQEGQDSISGKFIGSLVITAQWNKKDEAQEHLNRILDNNSWWRSEIGEVNHVNLITPDGHVLDALEGIHNEQKDRHPSEQKWILVFNANQGMYEHTAQELIIYAFRVGASILLFNYRGVGRSTGHPHSFNDLLVDGETCLQYLLANGVEAKNVLFRGRSMGGAAALQLRSLYPEGPILHDRSFASLESVISSLYGNIAAKIVDKAHWKADLTGAWDKVLGDRIIVYHSKDQMIPFKKADLESKIQTVEEVPTDEMQQYIKNKFIQKHKPEDIEIREYEGPSKRLTLHIGLHFDQVDGESFDPHNGALEDNDETSALIIAASKKALDINWI